LRKSQQRAGMQPGYDGHCLDLSEAEKESLESTPYVVRMKVPEQGTCVLNDLLRGRIEIDWRTVDMQVLVKADGLPTYHLANVVDDHLMEITHVIRGEEWISSAPKHQLLYEYLGWPMPQLCHMPLLRNPDKSKLAKRKNPTGILYYQRMGYLPEALLNYLGLMAWSMPETSKDSGADEKFSLAQMVEHFDLQRVSLGGPVFDIKKLSWLNGRWLRENLTDQQFAERVREWALNPDYLMQIVPLVKSRVSVLSELGPLASFFVSGELVLNAEDLTDPKVPLEVLRKSLAELLERIEEISDWKKDAIGDVFKHLSETYQIKLRDFLRPFYIAIAGSATSTPLFDSMEILGRDICRARLRHAQTLLRS
jgi:glutamyl-tRNA synthetase